MEDPKDGGAAKAQRAGRPSRGLGCLECFWGCSCRPMLVLSTDVASGRPMSCQGFLFPGPCHPPFLMPVCIHDKVKPGFCSLQLQMPCPFPSLQRIMDTIRILCNCYLSAYSRFIRGRGKQSDVSWWLCILPPEQNLGGGEKRRVFEVVDSSGWFKIDDNAGGRQRPTTLHAVNRWRGGSVISWASSPKRAGLVSVSFKVEAVCLHCSWVLMSWHRTQLPASRLRAGCMHILTLYLFLDTGREKKTGPLATTSYLLLLRPSFY